MKPNEQIRSHAASAGRCSAHLKTIFAEDNVNAADKVKEELRLAMRQLAEMPGMGHHRTDVADSRFRFWSVYSYLIAYLPDTKPLQIMPVIHGSRDIGKLFEE